MGKVEERINENYYKQIADKITQLLDKIRNSSLSDKRWVWELMQNAKDVPNKFGHVSVKIELLPNSLVFSHNGDCFTDKNITGLIQQVSSKDSANEGELKLTGKFGTGFITTHLLSNTIDVKGVVLNPNNNRFQEFNLTLDRSAKKSEDMIESIKKNLEWIKGLDIDNIDEFPIATNYESRTETDFTTSFTYPLTTEESLKSAQIGLEDLVNTLPITMVSLPKIKSVHVINHLTGGDQLYSCSNETLEQDENKTILLSRVSVNGEDKHFLTYKVNKDGESYLALSIEVKKDNGGYYLVKRDANQPVLFRDFPLIGSEEFYFPYMLNGFEFEPTETRSGILLNRNEDKPKKNRAILEDAIKCALSFNEWLLSKNAKNTYLIASSRVPKPQETYDEDVARPWIVGQIDSWRDKLLEQRLLETQDGYAVLKDIIIPDYGTKAANKEFYGFLKNFVQNGILPLEEQQEAWADTLSWTKDQKYSKVDFFEDLQRVGNVAALSTRLGATGIQAYEWLNKFYTFLSKQNDLNFLDQYPLIPNQYGNFCLLSDLRTDSSSRISDVLKGIYQPIIGRDLKDELLAEAIEDSVFSSMKGYDLNALIQEANSAIEENSKAKYYSDINNFTSYVSKIIALKSDGENVDDTRGRMFDFVSQFVDLPRERPFVAGLPASVWAEADRYILKVVPLLIYYNAGGTLDGLGRKILQYPSEHSCDESIIWINEYVGLAKKCQLSVPTDKDIFPNQLGDLKSLSDLHYDMNIPEEYKDLFKIATSNDARADLLDRRLLDFTSHNPLSTHDLYERITKVFTSGDSSESKKRTIAVKAFSIIPQTQQESSSDCQTIYRLYKEWDSNIEEMTIVDGNGFYPEIFCAFMLEELCAGIAKETNVDTLSERICKDEQDTVDYINQVIEYTENCFGKKYGKFINDGENGIWINQENDFCLLSDISRDDNVDEEVKEFALNPIVEDNFRAKLLRKDMLCEPFVPNTQVIATGDVLNVIDDALQKYVEDKRSLQDSNCAKLVISLNAWVKAHPGYEAYLKYFVGRRDMLIVGSINDDATLAVVGSIVSSPEKMKLFQEINKLPIESLVKIVRGEYILTAKEIVAGYVGHGDDLPTMELYETDDMTQAEQMGLNEEAKRVVLAKLEQEGFDISRKVENYSLVNQVYKNNVEFPLVVKSYKNNSYQFRLNPNEWYQLMSNINSMLLIHKGNGEVARVSFSQLFRNQDSLSLHFSLDTLGNKSNISKFAEILRYFKGCKFDFGSLMTTRYESLTDYHLGDNNPNAFIDFSSDDTKLLD